MQNVGNDDEAALKGPAPRSNHSILASRFKGGLPGAHLHIYCQRQSLGGGISHYCTLDIILEKLKKLN